MEIILIIVIVILIIYMFWPKNKKPGTPITKSRAAPETADPEIAGEEVLPESEVPAQYGTARTDVKETGSFFYGKKVCILGELRGYTTREAAKRLWERGAVITSHVDKSCEILICGDGANPMECRKAEQRGVRVMYPEELTEELDRL